MDDSDLNTAIRGADAALRQALRRDAEAAAVVVALRRLADQCNRYADVWANMELQDWCEKVHRLIRGIRTAAARPRQKGLRTEYRVAREALAPLSVPLAESVESEC